MNTHIIDQHKVTLTLPDEQVGSLLRYLKAYPTWDRIKMAMCPLTAKQVVDSHATPSASDKPAADFTQSQQSLKEFFGPLVRSADTDKKAHAIEVTEADRQAIRDAVPMDTRKRAGGKGKPRKVAWGPRLADQVRATQEAAEVVYSLLRERLTAPDASCVISKWDITHLGLDLGLTESKTAAVFVYLLARDLIRRHDIHGMYKLGFAKVPHGGCVADVPRIQQTIEA